MTGKIAIATLDEISNEIFRISRQIWEHPEPSYKERFASEFCTDMRNFQLRFVLRGVRDIL